MDSLCVAGSYELKIRLTSRLTKKSHYKTGLGLVNVNALEGYRVALRHRSQLNLIRKQIKIKVIIQGNRIEPNHNQWNTFNNGN